MMADGRAQVLQVATCPAGIATYFDVFFAGRGRNVREHASTPKGVQARDARFELPPVRLIVAAIVEVDRQDVGDVDLFNIARLAARTILVGDVVS
jgi:hypothetical protein